MPTTFSGFPPATLKFLRQLAKNNNKAWFTKNKPKYESDVLQPALAFVETMEKPVHAFSGHFEAIPKRVGGSLMRVYRDTRFSKDKTPYKTNIGIQFRHEDGKDVHAPGLYVHIEPKGCFLGAGMWHPDSKPLQAIRERIAEDPKGWKRVRDAKAFTSRFELQGDSLKRPPRGFDAEHPMIDDLKRKDFIAVTEFDAKLIETPEFAKTVTASFKAAKGFMKYLCEAVDVAF